MEMIVSLPQERKNKLKRSWSSGMRRFNHNTLANLIDDQMICRPNTTAIKNLTQHVLMTYKELSEKVNRLASYLQASISPISVSGPIGTYFGEFDLDFIISCIGILKSGFSLLIIPPGVTKTQIENLLVQTGSLCLISKAELEIAMKNDVAATFPSALDHDQVILIPTFDEFLGKLRIETFTSSDILNDFSKNNDLETLNTVEFLSCMKPTYDNLSLLFGGLSSGLQINISGARALKRKSTWDIELDQNLNIFGKNVETIPRALLPYISGNGELRKILIDWNNTKIAYPQNRTIHSFVEEQALRTPNSPAIITSTEIVTYKQLNDRANYLAKILLSKGVSLETPVGILLEARHEIIIACLAVLKSGGAFVPLSLDYPEQRLRFIWEELDSPFVISTNAIFSKLNFPLEKLIGMEMDVTMQNDNLNIAIPSNSLAYIIYTSGSTGTPKGVMVEHKSVVNMAHWFIRDCSISPMDRSTLFLNPAFDASVLETWPYLFTGGSLVVAPKEVKLNPALFIRWLDEEKITRTFLPTVFASNLIKSGKSPKFLQTLLVGGEKLGNFSFSDLPFDVVNCYGPTEVTVQTTSIHLKGQSQWQGQGHPPIGKPIDNLQVYVLNENLEPVGVGVKGELFITGEGLARGYRNNTELTNSKYISNPFSDEPNSRLYRSGDLVQWLPDGNLEYIGRVDDQVKIRGFRIETSEIQIVLEKHEMVEKAKVIFRENRLVSYVLLRETDQIASGKKRRQHTIIILKEFLEQYLPEYMIPASWVFLDQFSLTPNGKIDSSALPSPVVPDNRSDNFIEPTTVTEKSLAEIWSIVLKHPLSLISASDNFFELGGHSLLIAEVVQFVREILAKEIQTTVLFQNPILKDLANAIENSVVDVDNGILTNIIPKLNKFSAVPLSYAQELIWLHLQQAPDTPLYNETVLINMTGELNPLYLEQSINMLLSQHQMLRASFKLVDGSPMQVFSTGSSHFVLNSLDLSDLLTMELKENTVRSHVLKHMSNLPFDLSTGPLIRFLLIKFDQFHHKLCIVAHHLIVDGVSLSQVLIPQLASNYKMSLAGLEFDEQGCSSEFTYSDFALWQRKMFESDSIQNSKSLEYWRSKLADLTPLDLPTDRLKPTTRSFLGGAAYLKIPNVLRNELYRLAQENNTTLYIILLSALNVLLHRYCNQDDISICGVSAGRSSLQGQKVIGHFTNVITFRNKVNKSWNFIELLKEIHASTISAYEYQDYPFQKLIQNSIYKSNYVGELPSPVILSLEPPVPENELGWTMNQFDIHSGMSKFDLTIRAEDKINELVFQFEYNQDIFDATTVQRFTRHYETLLTNLTKFPNSIPISKLQILPEDERKTVIYEFNNTDKEFPFNETIHGLFEQQVYKTPNNLAISDGQTNEVISYAELNSRANQLANYLIKSGIGSESLVAVLLPRSIDFVVTVLGILKAGGAYVPLSEDYPLKRLEFILNDTKALFLISSAALIQKVGLCQENIIYLENLDLESENSVNLNQSVSPTNMAYIIYTSGSTGQPKGVMVEHRNVINFSYWHINAGPVTEVDRTSLLVSPAFDVCLFEMCPYLFSGASLHVAPNDARFDPKILYDWINSVGITMSYLPTALSEAFMKLPFPKSASFALRKLFIGGERLTFYPDPNLPFDVINCYGPTEVTVQSTAYNVRGCPKLCSNPSIGGPVDNIQTYVLDEELQPVPIGVIGEIYLGGAGVARGYLNRKDLTAERYVPNPFSRQGQGKIYKSGDLGRWLPNGILDFKGRTDDQVKIRGFRIELGEIQTQLEEHSAVQTAIVQMKEKELVAYILPKENVCEVYSTSQLEIEQVENWQNLYQEIYDELEADVEAEPSLAGWTSSYTGEPINPTEMNEWVDSTVKRILSLNPKNVLEIGSGSGLLFHRIAPLVDHYTATDFSLPAIKALRNRVRRTVDLESKTTIYHRTGDIFYPEEKESYDTVIINSVVQYFPDLKYLIKVLEGAVAVVRPGGNIFVGDVRSLTHLKAFHGIVQMHKAKTQGRNQTFEDWLNAVSTRVKNDEELVIDSKFFEEFSILNPKLSHATVQLKEGKAHNELNCFRYDVILHLNYESANDNFSHIPKKSVSYSSIEDLKIHLNSFTSGVLAIKGIPNAKTALSAKLLNLAESCPTETFLQNTESLLNEEILFQNTVDPSEIIWLANLNNLGIKLNWSAEDPLRLFDAIFSKNVPKTCQFFEHESIAQPNTSKWANYSNNPLKNKSLQYLLSDIKNFLKQHLPSFMIPSNWIFIDTIPLTSNGKVDKKALPNPFAHFDPKQQQASNSRDKPKTKLEEELLNIWVDVIERPGIGIGVNDSFFEIGGHSLLATKLIEKIFVSFGVRIPFRVLFESPTIQKLGVIIENMKNSSITADSDSHALILLKGSSQNNNSVQKPPVFFIHPVGGTVFCYNQLIQHLQNDRSYYAIQDPSIESGKILFTTISEMAAHYVKLINSVLPSEKSPLVLAGHSFGGLVAFQIAHMLGPKRVSQVFLLDTWTTPSDVAIRNEANQLAKQNLIKYHEELKREAYAQFDLPNIESWIQLGSHRYQMGLNYTPPVLNYGTQLIVFKAKISYFQSLEANESFWDDFCKEKPTVHIVPGDHDNMLNESNVQVLSEKISVYL